MDLGAFLRPNDKLAVSFKPMNEGRSAAGFLAESGGGLVWLSAVSYPAGQELLITLKLPGFTLDSQGDLLKTGAPQSAAPITLAALVKECSFEAAENHYVLQLDLWGRVTEAPKSSADGGGLFKR